MAVSAFVPAIWAARFTDKLRNKLVFGSLANRNYQGDIAGVGNTVKIPTGNTSITVRDYTVNTDIADAELADGETQDLVIDKQKYFHFYVDDVNKMQSRPSLMDEVMDEAAYRASIQVDADIGAVFNAAVSTTASARTVDITGTAVDANNAGWAKSFLDGLVDLKRTMTLANIPETERWICVHADAIALLEKALVRDQIGQAMLPNTMDSVTRAGFSGNLLGFNLFVPTVVPSRTVSNVARHRYIAGQGISAITHANQSTQVEAYRPERRFGDAVKGLQVYGTKAVHNDRLFVIESLQGTS